MNDKERTLHNILTATQGGTIVCRLAKELEIPTYEAFKRFFTSRTYAKFRTPGSIMSMLGDPAIVREYLEECKYEDAENGIAENKKCERLPSQGTAVRYS